MSRMLDTAKQFDKLMLTSMKKSRKPKK